MGIFSESNDVMAMRSEIRRVLGDDIVIFVNDKRYLTLGRYRNNEDVERFEEMHVKTQQMYLILYCDELFRLGLSNMDLEYAVFEVDTKFLGKLRHKAKNVLVFSESKIKVTLEKCPHEEFRKKTAPKRVARHVNKGRNRKTIA